MADDEAFFSDEEEEEVIDPTTLGGELYAAIQKNETQIALDFLDTGVPVDYLPESDEENNNKASAWSMIHWAAYHGNVEVTETLIQNGAHQAYKEAKMSQRLSKDEGRGGNGVLSIFLDTPLHKAAAKGHLRCVWLLLQSGYSVDDVDLVGNTPLHLAAANGHKGVVQCLCDHAADAGKKNNFKNTPANLCTIPSIRGTLKVAASKAAMTPLERDEVQQKHLDKLADLEDSILGVDMSAPDTVDIDALEEMIETGAAFGVSEGVIQEGKGFVKELRLGRKLNSQIEDLKSNSPIVTQTLFCKYVNSLKDTISEVETLLKEQSEDLEDAVNGPLAASSRTATDLCKTAHSEYWLCVATNKVSGVECASEETVKMMDRLKESIEKAEMNEANQELVEGGKKVLKRLTSELEVVRAKEGFPIVKLPVDTEEMSAKEIKEYWAEEDPEKPVNIGHIQETREWPKPPEETNEYVWVPSVAYTSFKSAYDRLQVSLSLAVESGGNQELISSAEELVKERGGDMELMEGKNGEDRQAAVAAAEKLAKKLGKKKKKK